MRFYIRFLWVSSVIIASCSCAESVGADDHVPNAALKYWQAFSTIPKMGSRLDQKLIEACREDSFERPVDRQLVKLIEESEYSLHMLGRGVEIRDCNWGIDFRADGAETLLPHLTKARRVARLALVRARYHFERSDLDEGFADIVSAITIARHVSHDGTIIGLLMGYSIEMSADRVLAAYLPQLDIPSLKVAVARFNSLPRMTPLGSAIESEALFIDWAIERLNMGGEGRLLELCETLTTSKQQAEELLIAGGNREQFIHHLDALRPFYLEGIKLVALPHGDFEQGDKDLARRLEGNPLSRYVFPNFAALYQARAVHSCYSSLLNAAIDVQSNGTSALQAHQDPYGDAPFEFIAPSERTDSFPGPTYRLRSRLTRQNGEAVQLTVGRAAH